MSTDKDANGVTTFEFNFDKPSEWMGKAEAPPPPEITEFGQFTVYNFSIRTVFQKGAELPVPQIKMPDGDVYKRRGLAKGEGEGSFNCFFVARDFTNQAETETYRQVRVFTDRSVGIFTPEELGKLPVDPHMTDHQKSKLKSEGFARLASWPNLQAPTIMGLARTHAWVGEAISAGKPFYAKAILGRTGEKPYTYTTQDGEERTIYPSYWAKFVPYKTKKAYDKAREEYWAERTGLETPDAENKYPRNWAGHVDEMIAYAQQLQKDGGTFASIAEGAGLTDEGNPVTSIGNEPVKVASLLIEILDLDVPEEIVKEELAGAAVPS